MKQLLQRCMTGFALLGVSTFAFAHHSFANFDMGKTVQIQGTVQTWEWANPHAWLWVAVSNGSGGTDVWGLEGASPGELSRQGWDKHSLKAGDKVTVELHPLRNGKMGGSLGKVVAADGRVFGGGGVVGASPGPAAP